MTFEINKSKINIAIVALMLAFVAISCDDDDDDDLVGNWVIESYFDGDARSDAVVFIIGTKAYVGTGYDGEDRLSDFYYYDATSNSWTEIAEFPGTPRSGAVAFAANGKGYVGTGYDGKNKLSDFWCYDPGTDTWDSIGLFEGTARYGAVAFAINDTGYVGFGYDGSYLKDFWAFDPDQNEWTLKTSPAGGKRSEATAFVLNNYAYVLTGINNGSYQDDFYRYDPSTDSWTKLRSIDDNTDSSFDDDYTTLVGSNKVSFVSGGYGYLVGGASGSIGSYTWEYDPDEDLWEEKTEFEGSSRLSAVGFALNDVGYVALGRSSSSYFEDIYSFEPFEDQDDDDNK